MRSGIDLAGECEALSLGNLAASMLPWVGCVTLTTVLFGGGIVWISRRAGDNGWEALRHGLLASFVSLGPLLTVLAIVVSLVSRCR
ncbi:hypothetical protein [Streptomyces sp. NPDC096132]|uniref:hypothetical protein n=1 Tax=Streptomyces sp. NPDC096132 TaxID=3366075 RepID=UPI003830DCB6